MASGAPDGPRSEARVQLHTNTALDRYPQTFRRLTELLGAEDRGGVSLLSFGCSTGEEAQTLAERYFTRPSDRVYGVDINAGVIDQARDANKFPERVGYAVSDYQEMLRRAPFDAVLAMSVLCAWPETEKVDDCSAFLPFAQFDGLVSELDRLVRIGGYLVIDNANFRFTDAAVAERYALCWTPGHKQSGFVHKFGRDNRKLPLTPPYPFSIFKKLLA